MLLLQVARKKLVATNRNKPFLTFFNEKIRASHWKKFMNKIGKRKPSGRRKGLFHTALGILFLFSWQNLFWKISFDSLNTVIWGLLS